MMRFIALSTLAMAEAGPNPIRRVVTLLQDMQKEITEEVAAEAKMYEKFKCYCKKSNGDLDEKTKEAAALIERTKAEAKQLDGQKKQLKAELEQHKKERKQAQGDLAAAEKKRAEEKAAYDEATKDHSKTIEDLGKAIAAIEKGMGRAFLQTGAGSYLRHIAESSVVQSALDLEDQATLQSFLQSGKDYSSSSGEIVGILKMIKQNISDELGGVIEVEEAAVKAYNELSASLKELIKTSTAAIESKTEKRGEVSVAAVEAKNLASNTEKQLGDDLATKAELETVCKEKVGQFETRQKDAASEIEAIGQAIEVLNADDSLEIFKATDTKEEEQKPALMQLSLLQTVKRSPVAIVLNALKPSKFTNPTVALLAYTASQTLKAGAVDFSKILKMIDDMVALLKQEANDDLSSRDQCNEDLNTNTASQKELAHAIKGLKAEIEAKASTIDVKIEEIKACKKEVAAANEAMTGATEQRKTENSEFIVAVDLNKQAVELLLKAKDKLNAYYNPGLVRKQQRVETSEEAAARALGGEALVQKLPGDSPEIFATGDRDNKGKAGGKVLNLLDTLINDLNSDTQALESTEAEAQRNYEKLTVDLGQQVADSNKKKNAAAGVLADAKEAKGNLEESLDMKSTEHADVTQTIADLHAGCDFILDNFEDRKTARESEIAGLDKAKAILSGAKFEF